MARGFFAPLLAALLALQAPGAAAAPVAAIHDAARQEQQPLLDTLRELVVVESGSKDLEGLSQLASLIAAKLKALGGKVEVLPATDLYRMDDTPAQVGAMVQAQWQGTGSKKILLIAHMDTVDQ